MELVGVSFSMEVYYKDHVICNVAGGYLGVILIAILVLAGSVSSCLILIYWLFSLTGG